MKRMKKYKLRAECMQDIFEFTKLFIPFMGKYILSGCTGHPDVEFEFESSEPIETIMKNLSNIPDSHVMMETLQPKSKYTGIR